MEVVSSLGPVPVSPRTRGARMEKDAGWEGEPYSKGVLAKTVGIWPKEGPPQSPILGQS